MSSKDIIFIKKLTLEATIGVYPWEKKIKQVIVLDLEFRTDIQVAAITDKLLYALNYEDISQKIIKFVYNSSFNLIETLADRIVNLIFSSYPVKDIKISLQKPGAILQAGTVGVCIERTKPTIS